MSMHKTPLTEIEYNGLKAHGLELYKSSQLSDAFRQGIRYALEHTKDHYVTFDDLTPREAVTLAKLRKCAMPELEDLIATNAKQSYRYAEQVLKGRFEKGEPLIRQDIELAYKYADRIIKGPWAQIECLMLSQPCQYGIHYARCIIGGRWPDLERLILAKKEAWLAFKYANSVIEGEWPEAEDIINSLEATSNLYSRAMYW